jgi:DNA polymerase-3 subunit delta'
LLTASPEQLLPTILSRCLRINFGRLAAEAEPPFRKTLLPLLLEHSAPQTSPVFRAYRLHAAITGILRQTRDAISQQIQTETNLDRYEELDPKVRERLEKEMEARITGQYRGALAQLLEELQSWWADLLLCAAGADDAKLVHRDHAAQLRRAVAGLSFADAAHNLDAIEQIGNHISRNIPETLAFEVGLLKLRAAGAKHS